MWLSGNCTVLRQVPSDNVAVNAITSILQLLGWRRLQESSSKQAARNLYWNRLDVNQNLIASTQFTKDGFGTNVHGYLARTTNIYEQNFNESIQSDEMLCRTEVPHDDATLPSGHLATLIVCQYVVYSVTFQVPAFYFTLHRPSGSPLSLSEIMQTNFIRIDVSSVSQSDFALQVVDACFPLLSQGEHPILGVPCWYLHPCETSTAMKELLDHDNVDCRKSMTQWLRLWFTILSNFFDLRLV